MDRDHARKNRQRQRSRSSAKNFRQTEMIAAWREALSWPSDELIDEMMAATRRPQQSSELFRAVHREGNIPPVLTNRFLCRIFFDHYEPIENSVALCRATDEHSIKSDPWLTAHFDSFSMLWNKRAN